MEAVNRSMLTPSPLVSGSDGSGVSLDHPVRVYVVTYLTSFWPHALAPPLHPVYSEQYDGLIGIYYDIESAMQAGTSWLEMRTEEMKQADPEDGSRPGDEGRKRWVQRGWSQVLEKGVLYEIWTNGIDPGVSRVIVKIRASVVCGLALSKGKEVVKEYSQGEEASLDEQDREVTMTPCTENKKAVTPCRKEWESAMDKYDFEQAPTPYMGSDESVSPYVQREEDVAMDKEIIEEAVTPYMRVEESASP